MYRQAHRVRRAVPLWVVLAAGCIPGRGGPSSPQPSGFPQEGTASWYGPGFDGRRTASGERFDRGALTAAHRTLPFGTRVRVHNLDNGREVTVRINDRGPAIRARIIDVSEGAARALGMVRAGVARVRVTVVGGPDAAGNQREAALPVGARTSPE